MRVAIALAHDGELHILPPEMPAAENLVTIDIRRKNGVLAVSADDLGKVRQIIGSSDNTPVVDRHGVSAAGELDAMLTQISAVVQRRIDVLRGDEEEDDAPAFKR